MTTVQYQINSSMGPIYLAASEKGLAAISWTRMSFPMEESLSGDTPAVKILCHAAGELDEYFKGKRKKFSVPLDVTGTPFQMRVWNELKNIEYGDTCSYGDIARNIKNDRAVRAVGAANGKNPVPIIVPCHRVISADGTLGGYTGGLEIKTHLLDLERKWRARVIFEGN